MDTDIAPTSLASGRTVPIGAECGGGVHDTPPGCAWQHGHEEYVWTPVWFTTSPHHGLVWSYPVIKTRDKFPLFGPLGNCGVQGRLQDQFGLLERSQLPKVPEELKESDIPRQVQLAEATEHAQIGLEQRKQALRPIFVDIPARVFLLGMVDKVMHVAFERSIAARGVCVQPTPRLDGEVRSLLHGLHGEIFGRLEDDRPLATDPRNNGRPVFIIMAATRLTFLAASTRAAAERLFPTLFGLPFVASGMVEIIRFHRAVQLTVHLIG